MGIIIWLIVGGIIGWVASLIMKRDGQQGILLNVIVGIVGSFLGGFLIAPLLGSSSPESRPALNASPAPSGSTLVTGTAGTSNRSAQRTTARTSARPRTWTTAGGRTPS